MKQPTKEWIADAIKKAPECKTSYEVMCADMLIPFGKAVECIKDKRIKIETLNNNCPTSPCYLTGKNERCSDCHILDTFPIHIARIFVAYCGWVKKEGVSKTSQHLSKLICCKDKDKSPLINTIVDLAHIRNYHQFAYINLIVDMCQAHKIDLASAVEIVLKESKPIS